MDDFRIERFPIHGSLWMYFVPYNPDNRFFPGPIPGNRAFSLVGNTTPFWPCWASSFRAWRNFRPRKRWMCCADVFTAARYRGLSLAWTVESRTGEDWSL